MTLDSANSGLNFKAYKASRATLSVDTDVDLDNIQVVIQLRQ